MKTLYKEAENLSCSINETFTHQIDEEHYFVSTRHGGWVILDKEEFDSFKSRDFEPDSELFNELKDVGIILTEDSMDKIKKDLWKKHYRLVNPPTYHVIPVSEACNMNCVYCHPDSKPGKGSMDRSMAEEILDFIFSIPGIKGKTIKIVLTGGEPLTNYDTVRFIVEKAHELAKEKNINLNISLQSNLTLMEDNIAEFLKEHNVKVGTSIDGPKELHNAQRPYQSGGGTYEDIVYWINRLRKEYGLHVGAISVVTGISLDYDPKDMVDTFRDLGQKELFIKPYRPQGRAKEHDDELRMTAQEFFDFYRGAVEYILDLWRDGTDIIERTTREYIENFTSPKRRSMCKDRPCGAGITMLSWTKDGDIIACDSLRSEEEAKLGNVKEDSYLDIRAAALPLVSMTTDVTPECTRCPFQAFCGMCPGNSFGEHDDPMPKPPLNFECQWQKKAFDYLLKKFTIKEDREILKSWSRDFRKKRGPKNISGIRK